MTPRCRANSAHVRKSRTDAGLGLQVKACTTLRVDLFSLGSGYLAHTRHGGEVFCEGWRFYCRFFSCTAVVSAFGIARPAPGREGGSAMIHASAFKPLLHIQDSHGQILPWSLVQKTKPVKLFPLRSEAAGMANVSSSGCKGHDGVYLTQCINQMFLESQHPPKNRQPFVLNSHSN